MSRLTVKDYIEQSRVELIENIGETYSDSYLIRMASEGCRRFISGVPIGAGISLEPMFFAWANKTISQTLATASDSVSLPGTVRRIWKVSVDGVQYDFKKYEDFDINDGGSKYTVDTDGIRFMSPLNAGAIVSIRASVFDKTLTIDNQEDTFEVIRTADEPFLIAYICGMAKRRNEYSATLADAYINEFNEGVTLARREGDVAIANDISSAEVMTGFFS